MDVRRDDPDVPPEARQRLDQAYAYDERGEFERALAECVSAIQLASSWAEAHNLHGIILEELNQKEKAVAAYREALRLAPSFDEARENLLEAEAELRGEQEGAGFWIRALARAIDAIVHNAAAFLAILLVAFIAGIVAVLIQVPPSLLTKKLEQTTLIGYASALLGFIAYHTLCEGLHGATLGKLICGLVVIKDDDSPCGLGAALGRTLAFFIDGLFFGLIAALNMRKSPKRQRLGDEWAGTIVARRRDLQPSQLRSGCRFVIVFLGAITLDGCIFGFAQLLKLFG